MRLEKYRCGNFHLMPLACGKCIHHLTDSIWHFYLLVSSLHLTERIRSRLRSEVTLEFCSHSVYLSP